MANSNNNIKNCIQSEKNVKETKKMCWFSFCCCRSRVYESVKTQIEVIINKNESPNTNESEIK